MVKTSAFDRLSSDDLKKSRLGTSVFILRGDYRNGYNPETNLSTHSFSAVMEDTKVECRVVLQGDNVKADINEHAVEQEGEYFINLKYKRSRDSETYWIAKVLSMPTDFLN